MRAVWILLVLAACSRELRGEASLRSVAHADRSYAITTVSHQPVGAREATGYTARIALTDGSWHPVLQLDHTGAVPVLAAPLERPALEAGARVDLYVVAGFIGGGELGAAQVAEAAELLRVVDQMGRRPAAPLPSLEVLRRLQ